MSERLRAAHSLYTPSRGTLTLERLRRDHERRPNAVRNVQILKFEGLPPDHCVYNPAPMLIHKGEPTLLGRVEHKKSEKSEVWAFRQKGGNVWVPNGIRIPGIEDPSYTGVVIDGKPFLLFWGVKVGEHPDYKSVGITHYNEYRLGEGLEDIPKAPVFARSPPGYKDGTVVQLPVDGSFVIFPRPQGKVGCRGIVCVERCRDLNGIEEAFRTARPVGGLKQLCDGEEVWGAITHASVLPNGLLRIGGHPACFVDGKGRPVIEGPRRDYAAMSGVFDPDSEELLSLRIDLTRDDLPPIEPKVLPGRDPKDLERVVFATSWLPEDGWVMIMGGLGDAEVFTAVVPDTAENVY